MADWAGKTLGKVQIDHLVARGGMAEVYTGTHESFGRVAVKVMRGLLDREPDHLARFQREAEVVEELRHPNIVQMFDYTVVDETPCLIMEYIPGPALANYLKYLHDNKQRLPIGIVGHILTSMASALDYAHSKGMVHRDIKPANVLLRSRSENVELDKSLPADVEPVLTDFGLVRLLDSTMHTTAGSVSGTPTYMSPEQARGEKVDKRTDIYSFGIMLYEMLAGEVPFQADTTFGMLMKHINEPPQPIKGISKDMQALLDRALAKDPSLRYESAGDLANEFMALFNGQTISPGTMHIAEMARKAAEASRRGQLEPVPPSRPIRRIVLEIAIVAGLFALIFPFLNRNGNTANAIPTATKNPNIPVGRLHFEDPGAVMDGFTVSLPNIALPQDGKHLEGWLISDDGETTRNVGPVTFNEAGVGLLEFADPKNENILATFNQIIITLEQGNLEDAAPATEPSSEVIYSSIFPPETLTHIRELLVSDPDTPNEEALIQGLYYYSGQYIFLTINGDPDVDPELIPLVQALQDGDEETFRKRTEEIINLIVGDADDLYQDYDNDGTIDQYGGDGYGSLPSSDRLGYIRETVESAKAAADAADSTSNIRTHNQNLQACLQNMDDWTNQLLPLALQLVDMPMGSAEMESVVQRMSDLGTYLLVGQDGDDANDFIDPILGECGADALYPEAYFMADMDIYTGPDRMLLPGK
jgi:tRNA A-37 threonylcarbamoyl transferase component Bud32